MCKSCHDKKWFICAKANNITCSFRGEKLNKDFVIDALVNEHVIIEYKSVEILLPVHEAQLVTYLKLANKKLGLLINFNVLLLKDGIRRKINGNLNSV